jgi:hypothetical protein
LIKSTFIYLNWVFKMGDMNWWVQPQSRWVHSVLTMGAIDLMSIHKHLCKHPKWIWNWEHKQFTFELLTILLAMKLWVSFLKLIHLKCHIMDSTIVNRLPKSGSKIPFNHVYADNV